MNYAPKQMLDAIPEGCTFLCHRFGSTWNDGGEWHDVIFRKPDGSGGIIRMETDYRPHDLTIDDFYLPPATYSQEEAEPLAQARVAAALREAADEEYDTHIEVALNPYGAWQAIQAQAAEIERLRKRVEAADEMAWQVDCALDADPKMTGAVELDKALAAYRETEDKE